MRAHSYKFVSVQIGQKPQQLHYVQRGNLGRHKEAIAERKGGHKRNKKKPVKKVIKKP